MGLAKMQTRQCALENCLRPYSAKDLCNIHYYRKNIYGDASLYTSGYRGVQYNIINKNWRSRVTWLGKVYELGSFKDSKEAAYIRDQAALQLHGPNTTLNFNY